MVPLKTIGITRREQGLDADLGNAKVVLFPAFFLLPLLLLLLIAVVSTRWHQPTGAILRSELGCGDEDNPGRGNFPQQPWPSGLQKQSWLSWV